MGKRFFTISVIFAIYSIAVSSCTSILVGGLDRVAPSTNEGSTPDLEVAPVFRAFYEEHGGNEVLGIAISSLESMDDVEYQYIESGCMVFSPNSPGEFRFEFAPLGIFISGGMPEVNPLTYMDNSSYDNIIYDEFIPFYNQLGGEPVVGKPLTGVRLNSYYKRYEQYFEKLGLYRLFADNPGEVKLLAYGAWICEENCSYSVTPNSKVDINLQVDLRFSDFIEFNGIEFTGFPLTDGYETPDGRIEQVFERVILSKVAQSKSSIVLKDLYTDLNLPNNPPVGFSEQSGMKFYEVEEGKGYEVPVYFYDYIVEHGGFILSGKPISRLRQQGDNIRHQCFEKYCLIYYRTLPPRDRVQAEMLGYSYREIYYRWQSGTDNQ